MTSGWQCREGRHRDARRPASADTPLQSCCWMWPPLSQPRTRAAPRARLEPPRHLCTTVTPGRRSPVFTLGCTSAGSTNVQYDDPAATGLPPSTEPLGREWGSLLFHPSRLPLLLLLDTGTRTAGPRPGSQERRSRAHPLRPPRFGQVTVCGSLLGPRRVRRPCWGPQVRPVTSRGPSPRCAASLCQPSLAPQHRIMCTLPCFSSLAEDLILERNFLFSFLITTW